MARLHSSPEARVWGTVGSQASSSSSLMSCFDQRYDNDYTCYDDSRDLRASSIYSRRRQKGFNASARQRYLSTAGSYSQDKQKGRNRRRLNLETLIASMHHSLYKTFESRQRVRFNSVRCSNFDNMRDTSRMVKKQTARRVSSGRFGQRDVSSNSY
jgi:hypothetical protein